MNKRFKILIDWSSGSQLEDDMEEAYDLGYRFVSMTTACNDNELHTTVLMELKDDV